MGLLGDYLPNWLPEDPNKNAAARAGLLQFGAALLSGRGNFGGILGDGLAAGSQGYNGAIQQAQKDQMEAAQMKILQNKDGREQRIQSILGDAFGGAPKPGGLPQNAAAALAQGGAVGSIGPTVANAAHMDALTKVGVAQAGKFPMSLMQVAALKAAGGPDLSPEYKMANEGFKREQGATYEMPDGSESSYAKLDNGQVQARDGSISNANGYVDSMAQTEAAKAAAQEQAKAERELLDPTKFIGADGRPVADTRAGYIRKLNELPKVGAPRPQPMAAPVAKAGFPIVTPQEQKSRDGDRLAILMDERTRISNPTDLAAIDREIIGAGGKPPAPAPGALQTAAEAKAQTGAVDTTLKAGQGLNENWIKEVHNHVQNDGKAARATLTQLDTIKNINFTSGWGSETKAGAANILASLGVKDAAKYASSAQQFQQVAMERNMTMLAAQVGPQTEGDSQRAQQTFVKLANTPAANQFIADLTGANARIAAKKAAFYNEALPLAKVSGDLTEIDRRWSKIAPSVWSDSALSKYKVK